ncbi:MAG: hypothetical protein HRT47_11840 [Candidatus Caenarcaniphilales bacterium]|nr:hypothetical protein [Candidatus Caenarcaniphilales bacterium]
MDSAVKKASFPKLILSLVIVFILLVSALYGFFELYLKKNWETLLKDQVKTQTGISLDFDKLRFNFLSFLKLQPSLEIQNLKVEDAVSLDKFYLELKLKSLLERKMILESIKIIKPSIALYSDENHIVHLKGIDLSQLQAQAGAEQANVEATTEANNAPQLDLIDNFTLDSLEVVDAYINYEPYGAKPINLKNLNLSIADLELSKNPEDSEKVSKIDFNTKLFGSDSSKLVYRGDLGPLPLDLSSLKSSGKLDLNLNLAELDSEFLAANAPLLAMTKSGDDHIKFSTKLSGDLLDRLSGNGNLSLNDLKIGADPQHLIKLNSLLSFNSTMNLIKNPFVDFKISKGAVAITNKDFENNSSGNLEFTLDSKTFLDTQYSSYDFSGSLEGLKIDELMHAFDPKAVSPITGLFEMPHFEIQASGKTPEEMNKSMTGHGSINFHDGKIVFLDQLKKKKNKITRFLPIDTSTLDKALDSKFAEASSKFNIAKEKVLFKDILVKNKLAELTGSGKFRFDNYMNFDLLFEVPKQMNIAFNVKGMADKPGLKVNSFNLINGKTQSATGTASRPSLALDTTNVGSTLKSVLGGKLNKADPVKKEKVEKAAETINQLLDIGNQFLKN